MARKKAKTSKKEKTPRVEVSGRAARAVRDFTMAHKNTGYDRKDLDALRIYLLDLYDVNVTTEGLHALVEQAKIEAKAKAVAEDMESILFSPERPAPRFKLGSAFCQKCERFKNYKKECPFCGYHEMTV